MGAIGPSEAERQIAIRLAEAGHFEDAARIAAQIADPRDQARAVRDVVSAHLQTESVSPDRRLREVSDLVARISRDPAIVAELATRIAAWLTDQGDKAGSVELLARAEQAAVLIGDASQQGQALAAIALQHGENGEGGLARATVDKIKDAYWRSAGYGMVAVLLADAGDFAGAEAAAAAIDDGEVEERDTTYARLADRLALADQVDEARRVIGLIQNEALRTDALSIVTQAGPELDLSDYEARAWTLPDPKDRAKALGGLARRLVETGRLDDAEAFSGRLVGADEQPVVISSVLKTMSEALWEAGHRDLAIRYLQDAERFAALIADTADRTDDDRADRMLQIARLHIAFGQLRDAERVATGIVEPDQRVFALKDTAAALAADGQIAEVQRLAAIIGEVEGAGHRRGDGLADVATALAAVGEIAAAEAVADGIVEPSWRANALSEVAVALAQGGHLADAERIARRVEDAAWRAVALAAVAARS
jgi:hypothetical protein